MSDESDSSETDQESDGNLDSKRELSQFYTTEDTMSNLNERLDEIERERM